MSLRAQSLYLNVKLILLKALSLLVTADADGVVDVDEDDDAFD